MPTVTAQVGSPDPGDNPTSLQELADWFNTHSLAEPVTGGPFTPYVISDTTPQVADQDKLWAKVDANGRPLEIRSFYNGTWRRFYNGNTSELRMFKGDPTVYFDNTGLGTVGLAWDGWAVCNGNNGTDNWSDLFPVYGRMDNTGITGYSAGHWNTNVTGVSTETGGAATYSIKNTDLPSMKVYVTGLRYSAGAATGTKRVLVDGDHAASPENTDLNPIASFGADPGGTPPVPQTTVPTLPPYKAACLCQFVGYQ